MYGTVFNIQHFSLNDGPGIRTVVFLKGCPLDCGWCHNPEGKAAGAQLLFNPKACVGCGRCAAVCPQQAHRFENGEHRLDRTQCTVCGACAAACPNGALEVLGRRCSVEDVMAELAKDDIFFGKVGGVTFSGGEPFSQPLFLLSLLKRCREKGYAVCVETSGFANGEDIDACAAYVDRFLFDIKETDPRRHRQWVGVDNERILANLARLNRLQATVVLRCPIIPGVNDRREHFEAIAALADQYDAVEGVELMPYHPLGLAKAAQIGGRQAYDRTTFLEKETASAYVEYIQERTDKPVSLG